MSTKIDRVIGRYNSSEHREVFSCPVCDSNKTTKLLNPDRYGMPVTFRACQNCELVYMSPLPEPSFFEWFYDGMYRGILEELFEKSYSNEALEPGQKSYAAELFRFLEPHLKNVRKENKLRLLDIGGSTGIVAIELKRLLEQLGIELEVVVQDPAAAELEHAASKGCETICGLFESIDVKSLGSFDIILLCQTIDHLYSLDTTFQTIKELMYKDTLLFVDYVDFKFNCSQKGLIASTKIDHIFNFSEKNFQIFIKKMGLGTLDTCVSSDHHLRGFLLRTEHLDDATEIDNANDYIGWLITR